MQNHASNRQKSNGFVKDELYALLPAEHSRTEKVLSNLLHVTYARGYVVLRRLV